MKVGVALNPATPVETLSCVLDQVDMILLMSVNPGFGGQKFIPTPWIRLKKLRAMLNERGLQTDIQVDGGVGTWQCKGTDGGREPMSLWQAVLFTNTGCGS